MLGRIGRLAPGVVFGPPRTFTGDEVRVGPPEARILDGLVGIDGYVVLRGPFSHVDVMAGHVLSVMVFPLLRPIGIFAQDTAGVRDVAGFYRMNAIALVVIESLFELAFVKPCIPGSFMVPHDLDAFFACVFRDAVHVEIGIGYGELEIASALAPPAFVPAFHKDRAEAMVGREIDVFEYVIGGRAVLGSRVPAPFVEMHSPPDADVFLGFDPADIAQPVGLVEVEKDVRGRIKRRRVLADQDGPPRRFEGRFPPDLPRLRGWSEAGAEALVVDALQPEGRIIDQRRFVERDVKAVRAAESDRGMGRADLIGRGVIVEIFVTIPFTCGDPPCFRIAGNRELGKFFIDHHIGELRLIGKGEAEAQTVVEHPDSHVNRAFDLALFGQPNTHFIVFIDDQPAFAPRLFPGFVRSGAHRIAERDAAAPLARAAKQETQLRGIDDRRPVAVDGIGRRAVHRGQRKAEPPVGRTLPMRHIVLRGQAACWNEHEEQSAQGRPSATIAQI